MALGSALIGGAAALGSGLLNFAGLSRSNRIAQDQFKEQMKFQREMMYEQKRLNSPTTQVNEYRQAGINPALAMYGGSSISPVTAPTGSAPNSSVTSPDFSFMPTAASSLMTGLSQMDVNESNVRNINADTGLKESQKVNQDIRNAWEDEENKSRIYNRDSLSWLQDINSDIAKMQLLYDKQSLGDRLFEQKWRSEQMRGNAMSAIIAANYADQEHAQALKNAVANAYLSYASGQSSLKQAHTDMLKAFAMYGSNDSERSQFFRATLDLLEEQGNESRSKQFGEWIKGFTSFNIPVPAGSYQAGETINRQVRKNNSRRYRR